MTIETAVAATDAVISFSGLLVFHLFCLGTFSFIAFNHPYRALSFTRPLLSVSSPAGVSFSFPFNGRAADFVFFESNVRVD